MHFCGPDQLHGYEERLTSDIYPGDYGWSVNWDEPVSFIPFFRPQLGDSG
jgi:choline-sulfatase